MTPAIGTAAACSKLTLAGFTGERAVLADADVLRERSVADPEDIVAGLEPLDRFAAASTVPAKSVPTRWPFGCRRPSWRRSRYGVPTSECQSSGLIEAARIRTSTSSSAGAGFSISRSSSTSGEPYASRQIAFIVTAILFDPVRVVAWRPRRRRCTG